MTPTLSVIVPTFNRAALLPTCIRSVQECGFEDIEIIVVDDGSTDGTAALARQLGPVRYVRQDNSGPSAARNHGFDLSTGKYVAFLDSDDRWLPGVPARMVGLLEDYPTIDVLFADAHVGNDNEGYQSWIQLASAGQFATLPAGQGRAGLRIFEPAPFFRRLVQRNLVFPGATLLRREVFVASGGYDPQMRHAEDWELWLRLAGQARFAFWPEAAAVYYKHGAGLTSDAERMQAGFVRALSNVLDKGTGLARAERDWVKQHLRDQCFYYAYGAYDRGNYDEARRRFARLRDMGGWQFRDFLLHSLCRLPGGLVRRLRTMKQSVTASV